MPDKKPNLARDLDAYCDRVSHGGPHAAPAVEPEQDDCVEYVPGMIAKPEQPTIDERVAEIESEAYCIGPDCRCASRGDQCKTTNNAFVPCSICSIQWLPERLNDGACEDCHERFIGDGRYVPNHLQIRYRAWKLAERIERETPEAVAGRFPDLATVYADVRYASALGWVDGQEWFTEEHHWRGSDVF